MRDIETHQPAGGGRPSANGATPLASTALIDGSSAGEGAEVPGRRDAAVDDHDAAVDDHARDESTGRRTIASLAITPDGGDANRLVEDETVTVEVSRIDP